MALKKSNVIQAKLEQQENYLDFMQKAAKAITSILDLNKVLEKIMSISTKLVKSEAWSLLLFDAEKKYLVFRETLGTKRRKIKGTKLKFGQGIAGWVAKEQKSILSNNVKSDSRFYPDIDRLTGFNTKSILCVPLISKGKTLGVIEIVNKAKDEDFSLEDLQKIETVADFASIAIENAMLYQKSEKLAITDDLTGLYNSRHFFQSSEKEINKAKKNKIPISFIFLDLDYFKNVNDIYGHQIGGQIIKEVGKVIKKNVSAKYIIARYGGDEYIMILPRTSCEEAFKVAEKLRKKIKNWEFLKEQNLNIRLTASFGVATYPVHAKTVYELVQLADKAMYVIKNRLRDGVCIADKL
jgi:diguanylate cyclase (GGDEF)-like protein